MKESVFKFVAVCGFLFFPAVMFAGTVSLSTDTELPAPNPDPNEVITVWVNTDAPLFFMNLTIRVVGDATITEAMDADNIENFGWEPMSDENGIIEGETIRLVGLNWSYNQETTIAYFKLRVNSSRVSVYIDEEKTTVFSFNEDFACNTDPLLFGTMVLPPVKKVELPTPILLETPPNSIPEEWVISDPCFPRGNEPRDYYEQAGMSLALTDIETLPIVDVNNIDITAATVWDANSIYYVHGNVQVQSLLVVEPGTIVAFDRNAIMVVNNGGTVISRGTPTDPIIYTPDILAFEYPDLIGKYYNQMSMMGYYYGSPLYFEPTASVNSIVQYCLIEGSYGLGLENICLDNPVKNNVLSGNRFGVWQQGPNATDLINNLCFYNDMAGICLHFGIDPNIPGNTKDVVKIEQNTCDNYQYSGILVYGHPDPNEAPNLEFSNNLVTNSFTGMYFGPGSVYALISNTGYYDNYANKNWDFAEFNPVYDNSQESPYMYVETDPFRTHYLRPGTPFVNGGVQPVERTKFIGTTTDPTSRPDTGLLDLGYHHMDWEYTGTEQIIGTEIDDIAELASYWLENSPYEPNSPSYIDPNLYIYDPNHPENWIDPNTVHFYGDHYEDGHIDLLDLKVIAESWRATPDTPNLSPVIINCNIEGCVQVSATGYSDRTESIYAYVDGQYAGQVYGWLEDTPVMVDLSIAGEHPRTLKLIVLDTNDCITGTVPVEIPHTATPLHYCFVPEVYEPNKPIPFAAYSPGGTGGTVSLMGDLNEVLWSQTFTGDTITGSIPATYTGEYDIVGAISFKSGDTVISGKVTVPKVSLGRGISNSIEALIIIPDRNLFNLNPSVRTKVLLACRNRGIECARLESSQATWENIARYGQYGFIRYVYFLGHGDYRYGKDENEVLRTRNILTDGRCVSCKATEFIGTPPSWCKPLPEKIEANVHTWASMRFDRLRLFFTDQCFGGRLKIDGTNKLVEGQTGQIGVFDGPHSDMSLALGLDNTYEARAYHGWYSYGWVGYGIATADPWRESYQKWSRNVWFKLGESSYNLQEALEFAIQETESFTPRAAVNNYRLKGQGDITTIRLKLK